jgi:hypothetical protein
MTDVDADLERSHCEALYGSGPDQICRKRVGRSGRSSFVCIKVLYHTIHVPNDNLASSGILQQQLPTLGVWHRYSHKVGGTR